MHIFSATKQLQDHLQKTHFKTQLEKERKQKTKIKTETSLKRDNIYKEGLDSFFMRWEQTFPVPDSL